MLTFTITLGKGDAQTTRTVAFDPEDVTLGFLEDMENAQETKRWKDLRPVIAEFLGLTNDEFRAMTAKQFQEVALAIQGGVSTATTIPNGTT